MLRGLQPAASFLLVVVVPALAGLSVASIVLALVAVLFFAIGITHNLIPECIDFCKRLMTTGGWEHCRRTNRF
jgi:hypothetical protein